MSDKSPASKVTKAGERRELVKSAIEALVPIHAYRVNQLLTNTSVWTWTTPRGTWSVAVGWIIEFSCEVGLTKYNATLPCTETGVEVLRASIDAISEADS